MAGLSFTPRYTTYESVKLRLTGKVQFEQEREPLEMGMIPNQLLGQLIVDAESDVEEELRGRYTTPFVSKTKGSWNGLPEHTKRQIRMACDYRAVLLILMTDFGRGGNISADAMTTSFTELYMAQLKKLMGRNMEGDSRDRWRFAPPLDDLLLNPTNSEADNGIRGRVINTDADPYSTESYTIGQINDNSKRPFFGLSRRGRY